MISQYTWPNFRGGSDKDGVRTLMEEKGFQDDVQYGITKIFIRSPTTLFALEKARSELIPGIVILLQKQWRGYLGRKRYKKMKAAYTIMQHYRQYKLYIYIDNLAKTFSNAKLLSDYGKYLPWPRESVAVRKSVPLLKKIFLRWRAWMVLRNIPREEWPQLRIKMAAGAALCKKRPYWGQDRKWDGNYLAYLRENPNSNIYNSSVNNLRNTDHFVNVLFSAFVKKTNKHNKQADRVLMVTEHSVYKLDCTKFKNMKKRMPISEITGLSVSPGRDQLITIHSNYGNDLIISLMTKEDRVGELVGILSHAYYQLRRSDLLVTVATKFKCMLGNKSKLLSVEVMPEIVEPTFSKNRDDIVYAVPPSIAIIDDRTRVKSAS